MSCSIIFIEIDVTPPEITCPGDIEAVAEPDDNTAKVMWYLPSMRDNSGELPTLTVIPAMIPPVMLPISRTLITYVAEDMTGNKANCTFTVTVIGTPFSLKLRLLKYYWILGQTVA